MLKPGEVENLLRGVAESERERMALTMYRDADATLASLLATVGPDAAVVVVSDHGVEIVEDLEGRRVSHGMGPPGVFFFRPSSAGSVPGAVESPTVYDVAPTVLALLGLPVPDYVDGHVLDEIVASELGDDARPRRVRLDLEHYEADRRSAGEASDTAVDEQSRERLRALGYVD
jgi:arylsulfatase A-like enzyme